MLSCRHTSRTIWRRACRCKPSTSSMIGASLPDAWQRPNSRWVTMSSSCRPASPHASTRSRHGRSPKVADAARGNRRPIHRYHARSRHFRRARRRHLRVDKPAASARRLRARVFWFHQRPLAVGGHITVRIGTAKSTAVVAAIEEAVDPGCWLRMAPKSSARTTSGKSSSICRGHRDRSLHRRSQYRAHRAGVRRADRGRRPHSHGAGRRAGRDIRSAPGPRRTHGARLAYGRQLR